MGHQLEPGYISIWVLKTRIEGERLRVVAAAWLALGGNPVRMSALHVRRDKAARSSGTRPPGDSLQPEATGAGMEVTKCLKPPDSGHKIR
jgi:hypothetical protein